MVSMRVLAASLVAAAVGFGALQAVHAQPNVAKMQVAKPMTAPRAAMNGGLLTRLGAAQLRDMKNLKVVKKPSAGLKRDWYLTEMEHYWVDLDANHDWSLKWQEPNPTEPFPEAVKKCAIVNYELIPASDVKDPKQPGKIVHTPEHYEPNGWEFFTEILKTTTVATNKCETVEPNKTIQYCKLPNGDSMYYNNGDNIIEPANAKPKNSQDPLDQFLQGMPKGWCFGNCGSVQTRAQFEDKCKVMGGYIAQKTVEAGYCSAYYMNGPDTKEAFLAVAALSFKAEDKNGDGVLSPGESDYLCKPYE